MEVPIYKNGHIGRCRRLCFNLITSSRKYCYDIQEVHTALIRKLSLAIIDLENQIDQLNSDLDHDKRSHILAATVKTTQDTIDRLIKEGTSVTGLNVETRVDMDSERKEEEDEYSTSRSGSRKTTKVDLGGGVSDFMEFIKLQLKGNVKREVEDAHEAKQTGKTFTRRTVSAQRQHEF